MNNIIESNKLEKTIEYIKESKASELVYNLVYPGILGSMIFDIVPNKLNLSFDKMSFEFLDYKLLVICTIKLAILTFFIIDYWHLYFIMKYNYSSNQKNTKIYMGVDLLVSILLLISIKSVLNSPIITFILMGLIPICFFLYGFQLYSKDKKSEDKCLRNRASTRIQFYIKYALFSVAIMSLAFFTDYNIETIVEYIFLLIFTLVLLFWYLKFVIKENKQTTRFSANYLNSKS